MNPHTKAWVKEAHHYFTCTQYNKIHSMVSVGYIEEGDEDRHHQVASECSNDSFPCDDTQLEGQVNPLHINNIYLIHTHHGNTIYSTCQKSSKNGPFRLHCMVLTFSGNSAKRPAFRSISWSVLYLQFFADSLHCVHHRVRSGRSFCWQAGRQSTVQVHVYPEFAKL